MNLQGVELSANIPVNELVAYSDVSDLLSFESTTFRYVMLLQKFVPSSFNFTETCLKRKKSSFYLYLFIFSCLANNRERSHA